MHDRAGTGVCMAMYSFSHQPPHQRRQGQAAPGRHHRRSRQRRQRQHPLRLRDLGQIPPPPPRGDGAVSERTYSPGQKEHVISAQHARALAGAQRRAAACACTRRRACVHVDARMRACRAAAAGFEENVLAWTEGSRDQKSHRNFPHYSTVTSKLDTKCFLVRFPSLFK